MRAMILNSVFFILLGSVSAQADKDAKPAEEKTEQQKRIEALKKRLQSLPDPVMVARKSNLLTLSFALMDIEGATKAIKDFEGKTDADSVLLREQSEKSLKDAEKRLAEFKEDIEKDPSLLVHAKKVAIEHQRLMKIESAKGWDHYFKPETAKKVTDAILAYIDQFPNPDPSVLPPKEAPKK